MILLNLLIILAILPLGYPQDIATSPNTGNDWMVRVTLTNGSVITGVVLSDKFIEKTFYARVYQECDDIRELNAGIRIWYAKNNPGFIFVLYKEVNKVVKLNRLSPEARIRIEEGIRAKISDKREQATSELEKQQREARLKQAGVGLTEEEEEALLAQQEKAITAKASERLNRTKIMARLTPEAQALLVEFPPDQGWSSEMYEKIKPRVLRAKGRSDYRGLPLSHRRFYENFEQWTISLEMYHREELAALEQIKQEVRKEFAKQEEARRKQEALAATTAKKEPQKSETQNTTASATEQIDLDSPLQTAIREIMYGTVEKTRVSAIEKLTQLGSDSKEAIPTLQFAAKDQAPLVRQAAIRTLVLIREPADMIIPILIERLELGDVIARRESALGLQIYGKQLASRFSTLAAVATMDDDALVRFRMLRILEQLGDKRALGYLQNRLWDTDLNVQVAAISGLLTFMTNSDEIDLWGREILLKGLQESDIQVKNLSAECLKRLAEGIKKPDSLVSLKNDLTNVLPNIKGEAKDHLQSAITILEQHQAQQPASQPTTTPSEENPNPENTEGEENE